MRSAQFYAIAIFVTGRLCPPVGGGAEVTGAADELARKAVPITSAPQLHGELKSVRDYFPKTYSRFKVTH